MPKKWEFRIKPGKPEFSMTVLGRTVMAYKGRGKVPAKLAGYFWLKLHSGLIVSPVEGFQLLKRQLWMSRRGVFNWAAIFVENRE